MIYKDYWPSILARHSSHRYNNALHTQYGPCCRVVPTLNLASTSSSSSTTAHNKHIPWAASIQHLSLLHPSSLRAQLIQTLELDARDIINILIPPNYPRPHRIRSFVPTLYQSLRQANTAGQLHTSLIEQARAEPSKGSANS